MRFARVVSCAVIGLIALAAQSQAQTPAGSDSSRYYAEFDGGPTFGHKSSGSFGGEGGVRITGPYWVFVEGGHMANVGTQGLEDRAAIIANAVGATTSTAYKVNYFDAGLRYDIHKNFKTFSYLHPYLVFGVGVAAVNADTAFAVNGTTVPADQLGIQLGADLSGTTNKAFLTFGGGMTYPFAARYFIDGTLRYGHIFARTSEIEGDTGINSLRLQFGVGVRF